MHSRHTDLCMYKNFESAENDLGMFKCTVLPLRGFLPHPPQSWKVKVSPALKSGDCVHWVSCDQFHVHIRMHMYKSVH